MKKVFFAVLLIAIGTCTIAQSSFLPRHPRFFYHWWYEDYLSQDLATMTIQTWRMDTATINGRFYHEWERAYYQYTDSPLTMVGIAAQLYFSGGHKGTLPKETFLNLYEIDGDSLVLLYHIPIASCYHLYDGTTYYPIHNIDYLHFDYAYFPRTSIDTCFIYQVPDSLYIREFYFDEPITVSDSFYISAGFSADGGPIGLWQCTVDHHHYGDSYSCVRRVQQPEFPTFRYKSKFYRIDSLNNADVLNRWYSSEQQMYPLLFPILQQAECKAVYNLHIAWQSGNTIRFEWDYTDESNLGWEFTYIQNGQSQGPIVQCSEPWVEISLEHGGSYLAYVRQKCTGGQYSHWGFGQLFRYEENSIANPSEEAPIVTPNPTTGVVTINSPYGLLHIEVYDMAGVRLLDLPCHDEEVKIDLSRFPAGSYLLKTASLNGTATQTIVKD